MRNSIMEMRSELSLRRSYIPKKSRSWSVSAVDFACELNSIQPCGHFDWPLHVWPTVDEKKFIIPVADYSRFMVSHMTCSLVHAGRFDLLEKVHFALYLVTRDQIYWVGISPTKLEKNNNPSLSLSMKYTILFILRSLINYNDLIEYLERYSTPYIKYLIKKEWDYFINRTEDNLEIRMYLMRYIQDAPQIEEEEDLVGEAAWKLWRM